MDTFNFCPDSLVPATVPRTAPDVMSLGGWPFAAKPTTPHTHKFKVRLHGLKWYLHTDGTFDETTDAIHNARALEKFYDAHEKWSPFNWTHPHLGPMVVRFAAEVNVPEGIANSSGLVDVLEVDFIEHNPGY